MKGCKYEVNAVWQNHFHYPNLVIIKEGWNIKFDLDTMRLHTNAQEVVKDCLK